MKYISLFSGIEAATVAWQTLGWEPVAYAEIEPFPKAVLKHHYPNVPDLGDMTKVNWKEYHHAADVVVGGSPCQAFSIAGLRKALDDPRGQLMLEYLRACAEIDPEWIVWENVPGVLTSFSLGMAPNVGTNANTGFQMETVKTGDVTWACLKHNREYIGCSTVETVK